MFRSSSLVRSCFVLAATWLASACSGSDAGGVSTPPAPPVEQLVVSISPKLDSILIGASRTYSARVATTSGVSRNVPVEFTSITPAIATVSNGTVTAIAAGEARIVARAGAAADTASLIVTLPKVALRISPSAVAATLGDTLQFEAELVMPGGVSASVSDITWGVSDSSAARIVGDGTVSTLAPGDLYVSAAIGGTTAVAAVKISNAAVSSVTIVPSNLSLVTGSTAQLVAELRDSRGRLVRGDVAWASSAPGVVTISADGLVTAVAPGGAIITARSGKKSATAAVNVSAGTAASVRITLPNDSLATGRTMQAVATPLDASGNPIVGRPIAWQSSNPAVATINSSGLITALIAGQTTISVICDGQVASQKLTIVPPQPASVAIIPATAQVYIGAAATLAAEVRDQMGAVISGAAVTWSSSEPEFATVSSNGTVTGVALGTTTIRATSGGVSGTASVTVQNVPVASVSVAPTSASVQVGATVTLAATARDAAGNVLANRAASWSTSNTAVATVSATGVVQGITTGSVTVTATVEGKSAQATVTVTAPEPAPVALVTVTLNSSVIAVGQATGTVVKAYDAKGTELTGRTIAYNSGDPETAAVSVEGRVKGLSAGSTSISANVDGTSGLASVTVQPTILPVASVALTVPTTSLMVGDSAQLAVVLRDSTGAILTDRTVSYTSSNTLVAGVTATGLVRALSAGTATLTATSEGKSATVTFTVSSTTATLAPVASVSVTLNTSTLTVGQGTQAIATLRDASNNILSGRTIAWSSSNTAVATVNQSGYVTAVGAGTAMISAQSEGKSGNASLTSKSPTIVVKTVQVTLSPATITVGSTSQATAVARDSAGAIVSGVSVSWSLASGSSVAAISGGSGSTTTATGLSAGTATVRATVNGVAGSATLTVATPSTSTGSATLPQLPTLLNFSYPALTGKSWVVNAGDNLQLALNNAQRGDEIVIQAGATFTGNFVLPAKSGNASNGWIVIRTDKSAQLPPQGTRVTPTHSSLMPKLITPNAAPALKTAASASGWWISGVEFSLAAGLTTNYGLVTLGDGSGAQNSLSLVPSDLVLDRTYVHATSTTQTSRCVALNSARTQVSDSYLHECHGKGYDTQAIASWNGPGPFKIVNNTLAGAGENVMFGGADPTIANLIPSDIELRRNYIVTPASWKGVWTKKNLLETKNVQRLLVEGNVFDGSWADAQIGWAFILKSANQAGSCTWCASRDITFRNNIIRNSGSGFNLSGKEGSNPYPVGELLTRVLIEQNIIENINVGIYTGEAKFMQILQNAKDVTIRNNTMSSTGAISQFFYLDAYPSVTNLYWDNNIVTHGQYGFFTSKYGVGEAGVGNAAGSVTYKNYTMIGATRSGYPNGTFASDLSAALATGRGANMSAVNSATSGVIIP